MLLLCSTLVLSSFGPLGAQEAEAPAPPPGFLAPVRLEASGAPIDVTVGHAAPLVMDFDGDGLRDLLVGEFGTGEFDADRLPPEAREKVSLYNEGRLRIYRNVGTDTAPVFEDFQFLRAGKEFASIPTT
jgi:hypothetical protein